MKMELVEDVRRVTRIVPPLLVSPVYMQEAIEALSKRNRIDTLAFLERQKYFYLRVLLAEVQHLDLLSQAFFLGVSETCLRKWRMALKSDKWQLKLDSVSGPR
jgi:hypothetical protein